MATERTKGDKVDRDGARLARSKLVTIRFDPMTHYLVEIAARVQRRSIANFAEWALVKAFEQVNLRAFDTGEEMDLVEVDALYKLWDPVEADRLRKIASRYPTLLDHDEQLLWKLVCEVMNATKPGVPPGNWDLADLEMLRVNWEMLKEAAAGGAMPSHVIAVIAGDGKTFKGIEDLAEAARLSAAATERASQLEMARIAMLKGGATKTPRSKPSK